MADAAHASSDIWHHSLEDLLKAIETGDTRPAANSFAIALQTSTTPIAAPLSTFPRFDKLRVYQLRYPWNDNSTRFQLRLGIITSDLEADAILATVRQYYPNATKEIPDDADRTAIAELTSPQNKAPVVAVPKPSPVPAPSSMPALPSIPAPPSKDVAVAPSTEIDALLEDPRWNIDELLPELASPAIAKRDKSPRNGVATQLPQPGRAAASPLQAPKAPVAPAVASKPAIAKMPTAPVRPQVPDKPVVPHAQTPAVARGAAVSSESRRPVEAKPINGQASKPAQLKQVVEKIESSANTARRVTPETGTPAAPPPLMHKRAAVAEKLPDRMPASSSESVRPSTADSGTLRSLVSKIGTLIHAVEAHAEAMAVSQSMAVPQSMMALAHARAVPAAAATAAVAVGPVPVPVPVSVPVAFPGARTTARSEPNIVPKATPAPTPAPMPAPMPMPKATSAKASAGSIDSTQTI